MKNNVSGIVKAHKILEEAFKEEFGDKWQIEVRDFEHGFSSFYDASINAIKRALPNDLELLDFELQFCESCFQMTNHLDGVCQKCKANVC